MSSNLNRLKVIAAGLGELCSDVVFVGGSVAELYADDPAATDIRPTMDVDCVIELATYGTLQEFETRLRQHGFENDMASGVICRWKYNGETVDVMPDSDVILGFTNQWYRPGFQNRINYELTESIVIQILPPLYYIATKIEALRSRGGDDLRFSHDFEDLIYVLNNRQDIISLFDYEDNETLSEYISAWASQMLNRQNYREEIECMLPYGDYDRVDYIIDILSHFKQ